MKFSHKQILDLLDILKRQELVFVASQLGTNYLSEYEIMLLESAGVGLSKFTNSVGIVEHAFLFGILSDAIGDERAKKMDYNQFKRFIASKNYIPLTKDEEEALEIVKNRAYTDITNLGSRMRTAVANSLHSQSQRSLLAQKTIKEQAVQAINLRMSAPSLAAELARATENWDTDWLRIAYYLTHEAYNSGKAQNILKTYGKDAEVWFDVYKGACKHCKRLYLEDPADEDSKPKVFKLVDVISNGNNIGRKVDNLLPSVSPVHPYCRCTINYKRPNVEWDDTLRSFVKPIRKVSKNKKLQGVKLNIKVSK